jgi:hypothetical protein
VFLGCLPLLCYRITLDSRWAVIAPRKGGDELVGNEPKTNQRWQYPDALGIVVMRECEGLVDH